MKEAGEFKRGCQYCADYFKFVLKEDVQNGALIINLVIMIIALILGYSGILKR